MAQSPRACAIQIPHRLRQNLHQKALRKKPPPTKMAPAEGPRHVVFPLYIQNIKPQVLIWQIPQLYISPKMNTLPEKPQNDPLDKIPPKPGKGCVGTAALGCPADRNLGTVSAALPKLFVIPIPSKARGGTRFSPPRNTDG
jgi:hypothetical protein